MPHPVEAKLIGELGADFLIDWVRTWLLRRPTDPGFVPSFIERVDQADSPTGLLRTVWENLGAIAKLTANEVLRGELESARSALPNALPAGVAIDTVLAPVTARLSAALMTMESAKPYQFSEALDIQLSSDAISLLRTLALVRHRLAGEPIPLAAPLLPRESIPARRSGDVEPALDVIEIGDLGDPFCRAGHLRVHAELEQAGIALRWRWLYFSSAQHWQESERVGALLESVAALAPAKFWEATDRLCRTTPYGAEKIVPEILVEAGISPVRLNQWLDEDSSYDGLRSDRRMALACGLDYLRPLFVIGRRLFTGLDAAAAIRELAETQPGGESTEVSGDTATRLPSTMRRP